MDAYRNQLIELKEGGGLNRTSPAAHNEEDEARIVALTAAVQANNALLTNTTSELARATASLNLHF